MDFFYIKLRTTKEVIMATKAKENERMRKERIAGSDNGRTMRTRVVKDKKKYTRKKKHKEEFNADECVRNIYKLLRG